MSIEIINPGMLTTIQDKGRFGFQKSGIGQAGAMDQEAYSAANKLVGNMLNEAVLEMTMLGAALKFTDDALCALTGADMEAKLDGENVATYAAFYVKAGQKLTLGYAKNGMRSYLAVQGGIDVPKVLGSRSTDIKSGLGGYEGRALKKGDVLAVTEHEDLPPIYKTLPKPDFPMDLEIRVILGPQDDYFTDKGIAAFLGAAYSVTPQSDRMGIRLDGAAVENKAGVDIVSDGITFGSVQIPASGTPIIMMADHQTAGGYAKIATVVSKDLAKLAQAQPGCKIHFKKTSLQEMQLVPVESLLKKVDALPPPPKEKSKGMWGMLKEMLGL